jgi:thiosulfate/3-mercaptopyruvate sulfurtransferase
MSGFAVAASVPVETRLFASLFLLKRYTFAMMRRIDHTLPRRRALALGLGAVAMLTGTAADPISSLARQSVPDYPGNVDPPLLVTPEWLNAQISARTPNLVILDLGDWSDYRSGHIPGAIPSYWQETIERNDDFYGVVLNQKEYEGEEATQIKRIDWLKRYGISNDSVVIACDHGDGRRAARIVWFLRFLGFPAGAVLEGGVSAWRDAGYALETSESSPRSLAADPAVNPQSGFYLVTGQLQEAIVDPQTQLVDIRSESERHDTIDDQFDLGVIPGSIWAPWTDFVADDRGTFNPAAEVAQRLTDLGIYADRRIILYGRFGADPDQMWLLLKLLAFPRVETYDRGWVEWSTRSDLPKDSLP